MERRSGLRVPGDLGGMCGCLKEVQLQALADQQVRQSSLRTHPGFAPYSAGNAGR